MIYCLKHRRRRSFIRSIVVDEMTMQKKALLSNYRHLDLLITYDGQGKRVLRAIGWATNKTP